MFKLLLNLAFNSKAHNWLKILAAVGAIVDALVHPKDNALGTIEGNLDKIDDKFPPEYQGPDKRTLLAQILLDIKAVVLKLKDYASVPLSP